MASVVTDSSLIQDNIEEYVIDANKIVTCRWLSLTLDVHINVAKQALYTFVDCQRNKGGNDDINVTYFVAGLGKTKSGQLVHKCVVVPETSLDSVRNSLDMITSCHVYSVQKAKLKDYSALHMTDYDIIREKPGASQSSIMCPWAKQTVPTTVVKRDEKLNTGLKAEPKESSSPSPAPSGPGKKTEKKTGIAAMFAASGKKEAVPKNSSKTVVESSKAVLSKKKEGALTAFFHNKSAANGSKVKEEGKVDNKVDTKVKVLDQEGKGDKLDAEVPVKDKKEPTKSKQSNQRRAVAKGKDNDGQSEKKRRRIIQAVSDSSESDEEENDEEDTRLEVMDSPPPPVVGVEDDDDDVLREGSEVKEALRATEERKMDSAPSGESRPRKRKRRLVPKQYVDDDGFMVTEKVWESDSTDASDKEVEDKKTPQPETSAPEKQPVPVVKHNAKAKTKPAPKKNVPSPQKGKQTSLMSFFKKK